MVIYSKDISRMDSEAHLYYASFHLKFELFDLICNQFEVINIFISFQSKKARPSGKKVTR